MEQYLIEQYNVFEDEGYLNHEDEIVAYFKDCGTDFIECGQGIYQDEASLIVKIGDKFYDVFIEADICSSKQDYGDRLYWVEDISRVTYTEIEKPIPKPTMLINYSLRLTENQRQALESFMKENYIVYN